MEPELLLKQAGFTWKLAELYEVHAFSVTSWFRTVEHNVEVGGNPRSLHLNGLAADLLPGSGMSKEALLAGAQAVGLHGVVEGDHVHVQLLPARG